MEDKRKYKGAHASEPQKAHLTGEFIVVTKNGLLRLGSMLATVVNEAVKGAFHVSWTNLKVIFCCEVWAIISILLVSRHLFQQNLMRAGGDY